MDTTLNIEYVSRSGAKMPKDFEEKTREKIEKVARLDPTLNYVKVEISVINNPSIPNKEKVQITATGTGHLSRAEAQEETYWNAFDEAIASMERSLRKVKERRTISKSGHRTPPSMSQLEENLVEEVKDESVENNDPYWDQVKDILPGDITKKKRYKQELISVDEALEKMELANHDFYIFIEKETQNPAVVYRRHAFNYGFIMLEP